MDEILKELKNRIDYMKERDPRQLLYIGLLGSQNYDMEIEGSDIDVVCIYKNEPIDIITDKKYQKEYEYIDGSKIKCMDLTGLYLALKKGTMLVLDLIAGDYSIDLSKDKSMSELFKWYREEVPLQLFNDAANGMLQSYRYGLLNTDNTQKRKKLAAHCVRALALLHSLSEGVLDIKAPKEALMIRQGMIDLRLVEPSIMSYRCSFKRYELEKGFIDEIAKRLYTLMVEE